MKKTELKQQYIQVRDGEYASYGGNQNWFKKKRLAYYGCGLVAAGDIILYLARHGDMRVKAASQKIIKQNCIEQAEYLDYLESLSRRFFYISFLIRGIAGPMLALGFNLMSLMYKNPYRAVWAVLPSRLHQAVITMLERDIPVLFSVGANFPRFWKKEGVKLYQVVSEENNAETDSLKLFCCGSTAKHYMTITGIFSDDKNGEFLRVSSWGKEYYIKWEEYENYFRHKSNAIFSNILYITKRSR